SPAEVLVRSLVATSVTAAAGQRRMTSVSWDGLDEQGRLVPADAYSLVLEFHRDGAGAETQGRAGVTLPPNAPSRLRPRAAAPGPSGSPTRARTPPSSPARSSRRRRRCRSRRA